MNMFLDGHLYCNTPEYYRLSTASGVSDRNESCMISVRENRGDLPFKAYVEDKEIGNVASLTIKLGRKEGWLNCWSHIILPEDLEGFNSLKKDFILLKKEFGPHYVFVDAKDSHLMIARIKNSINLPLEAKKVDYFQNAYFGHSAFNKSNNFSYQREFRLIIDECSSSCVEPKVFYIQNGFRDIAKVSPKLEFYANTDSESHKILLDNK